MERPWLSVVMPTYNGEAYLPAALDSLADQDQNGFECIAVDDGSTDQSIEILRRYQDRINLKIIAGERVGNWVAGTNKGLKESQGQFVSFLHQDDEWRPGRARKLKQLVNEHANCTFFTSNADFIDDQGHKVGRWHPPLTTEKVLSGQEVFERLIVQDFFAINNPMFSRQKALEIGGLNESLWYTADWDFWLRLMPRARVCHVKETFSAFRLHGESQTVTGSKNTEDFCRQLNTVLERHLAENPGLSNDVVFRAKLSARTNTELARAFYSKSPLSLMKLAARIGCQLPASQYRFFRDTGLWSRVSARLRAL